MDFRTDSGSSCVLVYFPIIRMHYFLGTKRILSRNKSHKLRCFITIISTNRPIDAERKRYYYYYSLERIHTILYSRDFKDSTTLNTILTLAAIFMAIIIIIIIIGSLSIFLKWIYFGFKLKNPICSNK